MDSGELIMDLIHAIRLEKTYHLGESVIQALKGIDLSIGKGEFVAVWGPSGSGKTTLLNLIGAIDEPSGGKLYFKGREIASLSDDKRTELRNRDIGFIFQGFNLIPVLSALENVMLPLQINGTPFKKAKQRALSRLSEVGLSNFVAHRPDKLSGGQQQRVAIARALVTDPSLIIADEPTANLDSDTGAQLLDLLKNLNQEFNMTFLFSTHDARVVERARRVVTLMDGRIDSDEIRANS